MKLEPLFARVLLKREDLAKKGSIIIPDEVQKKHASRKGVVIAKGPEASESIKIKSTVIFAEYSGTWVNSEGSVVAGPEQAEFYLVTDDDILCEVKLDD